jgi:hypothetical protein
MFIDKYIWLHIKDFIFHNIKKHGKHLKKDTYIQNYNYIMTKIPLPTIPSFGPRILYSSATRQIGRRFIKYSYYVHTHLKLITGLINNRFRSYQMIEVQMLPFDYDLRDEYDEILRKEYYNNFV